MDAKTIGYIEAMLNERIAISRQSLLAEAADECASEGSVVRAAQSYRRAVAARDAFCEWAESRESEAEEDE